MGILHTVGSMAFRGAVPRMRRPQNPASRPRITVCYVHSFPYLVQFYVDLTTTKWRKFPLPCIVIVSYVTVVLGIARNDDNSTRSM